MSTARRTTILPAHPRAGQMAREFLREACCASHATTVVDEAELMVSELVANAIAHGGPPITLMVSCAPNRSMEVRVRDSSGELPELVHAKPMDEGGRGVELVDLLSSSWGVDETGDGKEVWFLLGSVRPRRHGVTMLR